ncbi:MAG: ABC transporter substrate-binding protein [Candidatus Kapabacteria bacterium]|nr:ABC transporter substrate-binding protein [Candidatus Kapabacteria bacterium]
MGRKTEKLPSIAADTKVADLIKAYPEAIDILVKMGFDQLKNPIAQRTVAKLFSIEQAANFRGIPTEDLLAVFKKVAGVGPNESPTDLNQNTETLKNAEVPELKGDVRYLGLVPCPVRTVLTDKFDRFVQEITASTGKSIAWWMAGEGTGTKDVRKWLGKIIKNDEYDKFPDVFTAVGTEIFLHKEYGRTLFDKGFFKTAAQPINPRKEFKNLEDPNGILSLQFAALFTFSCRPDLMPGGIVPKNWADLAKPEYEGHVAFPSLDLPIMPDILGALYYHLGDKTFKKLAANICKTMHPAQSTPRVGKKDVPPVVIMPLHFTKLAASAGALHIIPEDGPVAVPAYMAVRKDADKEADTILEFLRSAEFLEFTWTYGSFVPNNSDIYTDIEFDTVISRPWDSILNGDPDAHTKKLISMITPGEKI